MKKDERLLNVVTVDGEEIVVGDNRLLPINDLRMATADIEFDFSALDSDDLGIEPENVELIAIDSKRFLLKLDKIEDNIRSNEEWNNGVRFNLCVGLAPADELQTVLYYYYTQTEDTRKRIYASIEEFINRCGDFEVDLDEAEVEDLIIRNPENQKEIPTVTAYRLLYAFEKRAYETGEDKYYERMLQYEKYILD